MFKEFKGVTKTEWLAQVTKDLKGKPLESLNWQVEGIEMTPFYHSEDALNATPITENRADNSWEIGERIVVQNENYAAANQQALDALSKGANALYFVLDKNPNQNELNTLLENVQLEWISTHFQANDCKTLIENFILVINKKEQNPNEVNCSFNIKNNDFFNAVETFKSYILQLPKGKFLTVDVTSELSVTSSLAEAITKGNAILELLNDNGFDIAAITESSGQAHQLIQFAIGLNDEYFVSIAKIRALKTLWQQVLTAWDSDLKTIPNIEVHLTENAQTDDENYNKIKATTQAMSAVIGGANRLYIYPSDTFKNKNGTTFSRRIALNVQHLLQQESYLDRVVDASAGSYFVEELTEKIAEKAWGKFQAD
jgi:methylmalonyl-CoA mutase